MRKWIVAVALGVLAFPGTAGAAAWHRVAGAAYTLDEASLAAALGIGTISMPSPDGGLERFTVSESPVMEPGLAAQHPEIKTYKARGVDDPSASARLDLTPLGFHASVRSADGAWYVDPSGKRYVARRPGAVAAQPFVEPSAAQALAPRAAQRAARADEPVTLRTYRLALLSDPQYAANTPDTTTAAKVVLVNRLDQIYEQDLAIRLVLVDGTDQLNFDSNALATGTGGPCGAPACFTSSRLQTCDEETLKRANAVAARILGAGSYDIAHLMLGGAGGGGLAYVGVVGTPEKGRACTGSQSPVGDAFAVDYVAHEVGHQFGAEHTFNSLVCDDSRADDPAARVEPGSGSTIMGYAGICGNDDLQAHSDPYFSQASIAEIGAQAQRPEELVPPVEQVALNGFDSTDSFRLTYNGTQSTVLTRGSTYNAAGIKTAIQGASGLAVTVLDVTDEGFSVYFPANVTPATLQVSSATGFPGGYAALTATSGLTRYGGTAAVTGNHAPSVTVKGSAAHVIPMRTPFELEAAGSDLDGDTLTYAWEQNDGGLAPSGTSLGVVGSSGPLFRSFSPTGSAARSFPELPQVLAGNSPRAELLPTSSWVGDGSRTLHFRVTARDNHPGYGGTSTADAALTVAPGTGPFRLSSQASAATAAVGTALPVTWDVAGTDAYAPTVKISLSLDGGRTFSKVLAAATPNDGGEIVTVPRVTTTNGRIRVQPIDNVFYDAARGALTIDAGSPVLVNGPPSADLGTALVGAAGAPIIVTFSSDGPTPATTGPLSIAGPVAIDTDGCSGRTLPAYSECTVTVHLAPTAAGAQAATLSLASNDPLSPATVALTGTATAPPAPPPPTPPGPAPPAFDPLKRVAALLGTTNPFAAGSAGGLRLYTKAKSAKLGKPKASMVLAAAVCVTGPCSGKATAKLTLTPRKGKKRSYSFTLVKALKLAAQDAQTLTLKLAKQDRKRIDAARKATLTLTVTNGGKRVTRGFTLTT